MHNPSYTITLDAPKQKRGRKPKLEDPTNWKEVAQKQEAKLKMYIQENEDLANICIIRWEEIQNLKYLVKYLEQRNADSSI
jgi:hypothetical protein